MEWNDGSVCRTIPSPSSSVVSLIIPAVFLLFFFFSLGGHRGSAVSCLECAPIAIRVCHTEPSTGTSTDIRTRTHRIPISRTRMRTQREGERGRILQEQNTPIGVAAAVAAYACPHVHITLQLSQDDRVSTNAHVTPTTSPRSSLPSISRMARSASSRRSYSRRQYPLM